MKDGPSPELTRELFEERTTAALVAYVRARDQVSGPVDLHRPTLRLDIADLLEDLEDLARELELEGH